MLSALLVTCLLLSPLLVFHGVLLFRRRAEAARQQEETTEQHRFLEALLFAIPTQVFSKGLDLRYLGCSRAFEEFFGFTADDIRGKTVAELWPARDAQVFDEKDHQLLREGGVQTYEHRLLDCHGRIRDVVFTKTVFERANGRRGGIVGAFVDVTDRIRAEEEVRALARDLEARVEERTAELARAADRLVQSQAQVRALLDSIPDIAWLKDRESRFLAVNQPFARACGFSAEELEGKTDLDIWPHDLAELYRADDRAVMDTGQLKRVDEPLAPAGEDRRTWIESIKVPIRNERGQVTGTAGIARDVTQRKLLEETLADAQDYLNKIINSVSDPIFVKDSEHRFVLVNDALCSFFGFAKAVMLGKSDRDFFPSHEAEVFWRQDELACTSGQENVNEEEVTDAGGVVHTVVTKRSLYLDQRGSRLVVGVMRDISERKRVEVALRRANLQLEAANRELEAFAYSVSHDLRAPLHAIDGFSQALLEDCWDRLDAVGRRHLERVRRAAGRMGQLIDDLLSLSRATRVGMKNQSVHLSAFAEEVVRHLREAEPERQVDVLIAPGLVVEGDPTLLRACLENLLGNAWKFTRGRELARVELGELGAVDAERAGYPGGRVFFVRDNGAGFEMAYAHKLFGIFQRLHRADEFPGTGVGLAIVQRIVHRHGGRVWAEGEVGRGATVFFTLS